MALRSSEKQQILESVLKLIDSDKDLNKPLVQASSPDNSVATSVAEEDMSTDPKQTDTRFRVSRTQCDIRNEGWFVGCSFNRTKK